MTTNDDDDDDFSLSHNIHKGMIYMEIARWLCL